MAYGALVAEATLALRRWLDAFPGGPGTRLPSERALARQLGLKHYAVNRAASRLIAEGQMERSGYKLVSASPRQSPSHFSCELVLAKRSSSIKSYRKLAKELGLSIHFHFYQPFEEAVALLRRLDTPETRSIIFEAPQGYPSSLWEPAMTRLLQHGIAAISVRQYSPLVPSILNDYARALELGFLHLRKLGHRELALLTLQPRAPVAMEVMETWQSLCRHHKGHNSLKRVFFQNSSNPLLEDARDLVRRLTQSWRDVTALIVHSEGERVLPNLLAELARHRRHVPQNLSLLYLDDGKALRIATPTISATAFDSELIQETALSLAQRMVRKKQVMGLLPPPQCLRLEPHFISRASTVSFPATTTSAQISGEVFSSISGKSRGKEISSRQEQGFHSALKRSYPLAARTQESHFTPISLKSFVNRPLNFRRGWLGDLPLKSLAPGTHLIHGVPFQVLGGKNRTNRGAVVFRSAINAIGNAKALPSQLRIPLGFETDAIYVLHGCGFARFLQRFATYQFFSGTKRIGSVPLITLGQPPPTLDGKTLAQSEIQANIQDWWGDFPHIDFPHARRAPLVENQDNVASSRHSYLYTLEWINPLPKSKISHMIISVDPRQSITLGLLAISLLKK